jgi:superfamily II DNA or RNA helicase
MLADLALFKSIFKGREDVFAVRWESGGKAGYMPSYYLDSVEFGMHKERGGSLKDFQNKTYQILTDDKLIQHLSGKEIIGIYPLLKDNTSWFIVADFDQGSSNRKSWAEECRVFIEECEKYGLPVYIERSRSGKGGHVWMFFEEPYPAHKSRKIFLFLLGNAGIISGIGNNSNFDRLFPNQDAHSGKGLGNLIALPFQEKAMQNGNTCFIDRVSLNPITDQWEFLQHIRRVPATKLDEVFNQIATSSGQVSLKDSLIQSFDGKIDVTLDNQISIPSNHLSAELRSFLKDNLNFMNVDFLLKKKIGKSTHQTDAFFRTLEEKDGSVNIPRGFIGKLLRFCKEKNIPYRLQDKRTKLERIEFKADITLHQYQIEAVEKTEKKDFGIIVAPPGTGKTVMGLSIIASKKQPALIIVHRKQLFDQWIERIESFLSIPKYRIGKIEGGKCEIGHEITVAMIQSLQAPELPANLHKSFGVILVDECHHIPAKTFRAAIQGFHTYYLYGFTATPKRKNADEKLMFIQIGEIIHEVVFSGKEPTHSSELSVIIRETALYTPFNSKTDNIETLLSILIHDTARNELIINDLKREIVAGRKVLILTERISHTVILNQYIKGSADTLVLTGNDSAQVRKLKQDQIRNGEFQVIIATGQFVGEGTDIAALDCLVLAYPFSFEGKLIQYIGRVQRGIIKPVIYDYRDRKIEYLENLFNQRNRFYRKLMKSSLIKHFVELVLTFESSTFYIHSRENEFPIEYLELPIVIDKFLPGISWRVRVLKYNEEEGELVCEILDYHVVGSTLTEYNTDPIYFPGIEKIKFRSIDTAAFLRAVVLKENSPVRKTLPIEIGQQERQTYENVVLKTMKVPFWKIRFLYGSVTFPIFITEINQELTFEIMNPDIRPEFESVKEYFSKILKKKLIVVDIMVTHSVNVVSSFSAKSDDINNINPALIESVRFEYIKKQVFKTNDENLLNKVNTVEDLVGPYQSSFNGLSYSEQDLFDDLLNIKKAKHFLQLKWLSSRHESKILKLRFVLQPFSFLFLLSGENRYHVIWETLDTEEATYIWHAGKSREDLRNTLAAVESVIGEIKRNGREHFLEKEREDFSRVLHDYSDAKKGFILWKGLVEERIF